MTLNVAVQMDPIERIKIAGDSTFALLLEAQSRGHRLLYYTPDRLTLNGARVMTQAQPLTVRDVQGEHAELGEIAHASILPRSMSCCCARTRPSISPMSRRPICSSAFIPRRWSSTIRASVRDAPEKLFVMDFPELMPATLISRDRAAIEAFRAEHGEVVMKPLYGNGGAAVFKVAARTRISARCSTCSA